MVYLLSVRSRHTPMTQCLRAIWPAAFGARVKVLFYDGLDGFTSQRGRRRFTPHSRRSPSFTKSGTTRCARRDASICRSSSGGKGAMASAPTGRAAERFRRCRRGCVTRCSCGMRICITDRRWRRGWGGDCINPYSIRCLGGGDWARIGAVGRGKTRRGKSTSWL